MGQANTMQGESQAKNIVQGLEGSHAGPRGESYRGRQYWSGAMQGKSPATCCRQTEHNMPYGHSSSVYSAGFFWYKLQNCSLYIGRQAALSPINIISIIHPTLILTSKDALGSLSQTVLEKFAPGANIKTHSTYAWYF